MRVSTRSSLVGSIAVLGLALALVPTSSTAVPQATAARATVHSAGVARHHKPWHAPDPGKLVRAVSHAHTTKARTHAVERTLGALGIGVYAAGSGRRIVGGFERGPRDLYLYDFEARLVADQLAHKRMGSFTQLAGQLAKAGEKIGSHKATGSSLAKAVAAGIRRLGKGKAKHTPGGVLAAVVRKLGQTRHVDLTHAPNANRAVLDPLQRLLIGIDATRSATDKDGPVHARRTTAATSSARMAGGGCDNGWGSATKYGKGIRTMVASKGTKGGWGIIKQEIQDGIDGVAMAYSVAIQPVQPKVTGAFGTNGPKSATPMKFQVKVLMLDDYNHGKPGCGRLAGYKLPKKGGIPGVPVVWTRDAVSHLSYLGADTCGEVCTTTTNADGIATYTFQPDDEYLPGVGPKVIEDGTTTASEFAMAGQHNILGAIAEATGSAKQAEVAWEVSYHHPAGYRVDLPAITLPLKGATDRYQTDNLEICLAPPTQDVPHPLKPGLTPRPPGFGDVEGRGPELGLQGVWSNQPVPTRTPTPYYGSLHRTITADGHSSDTTAPVALIPIDFQPTPRSHATGGLDSEAQWIFDAPTMQAHVTLYYTTEQYAGISPSSHTFDVPITQAQHCPPPLG